MFLILSNLVKLVKIIFKKSYQKIIIYLIQEEYNQLDIFFHAYKHIICYHFILQKFNKIIELNINDLNKNSIFNKVKKVEKINKLLILIQYSENSEITIYDIEKIANCIEVNFKNTNLLLPFYKENKHLKNNEIEVILIGLTD